MPQSMVRMAGYRQIHTKIWSDAWFVNLVPPEKLLYIYLFSNERTSVCGLYELPLRIICFETGLDVPTVKMILDGFKSANKVDYDYEYSVVWVKNMVKYQSSSSPKLKKRIADDIDAVPACPLKDTFIQYTDTVSIPYRYDSDTLISISSSSSILSSSSIKRDQGEDFFSRIQVLTGLMATANDIPTMTKWQQDGVIDADIQDALQWRKDNQKPPVKIISHLNGSVDMARLKRIQGEHAKAGETAQPKKQSTTPIDASKYEVKTK